MNITTKVARLEPVISGHTAEGKDGEKQTVIPRIPESEKVIAEEDCNHEGAEKSDIVQATYNVQSRKRLEDLQPRRS